MGPNELMEELRGTWGPAPKDPERFVLWNETLEVLAQVPTLLKEKINDEGTVYPSLERDFGSLEQLSILEAQCIERLLTQKKHETLQDVVVEITEKLPWSDQIGALNSVQKTRLRSRLIDDLKNNLEFILISLGFPPILSQIISMH